MAARALLLEDLLAVRAADQLRLREALQAGIRRDESGDVLRVLPPQQVGRHVGLQEARVLLRDLVLAGVLDLLVDDVPDRALLVAVRTRLGERIVEVRPDRPCRSRGSERVAARALTFAEEELLAVLDVGCSFRDAACAAGRQGDREHDPARSGDEQPHSRQGAVEPP